VTNAWWFVLTAVGVAALAASVHAARKPTIGPREVRWFRALNGLPDGLFLVFWAPMQLGNLVVGTVTGWAIALAAGDFVIAVGATLATLSKVLGEWVVRRRMAGYLAVRQRPGTSQFAARLRGRDVPTSGPSFPSGHAILVAALAAVLAPYFGITWWWLLALAVLLVMVGRVYVGAHNPLDVTAGAGVGLALGGVVAAFIR